jgi:hypothetical protein
MPIERLKQFYLSWVRAGSPPLEKLRREENPIRYGLAQGHLKYDANVFSSSTASFTAGAS